MLNDGLNENSETHIGQESFPVHVPVADSDINCLNHSIKLVNWKFHPQHISGAGSRSSQDVLRFKGLEPKLKRTTAILFFYRWSSNNCPKKKKMKKKLNTGWRQGK